MMKKQLVILLATSALLGACNKKDKKKEEAKQSTETQVQQTAFNKEQVTAIEQIVHKYIVNNPNVLAESIMNLQKQVADKQQEKVIELLNKNKSDVERTAGIPVIGAPGADVTILMFGDYTDMKSKAMFKMYQNILQKDSNVRMIFRFLPDTSALAQKAARVAMAMNEQGLFDKFHERMLSTTEPLTETSLMDIAGNVPGVNRSKLDADVDAGKTKEAILNNRALAEKLGITQAPGYVLGDFLLKQPITPEQLDMVIQNVREKKK